MRAVRRDLNKRYDRQPSALVCTVRASLAASAWSGQTMGSSCSLANARKHPVPVDREHKPRSQMALDRSSDRKEPVHKLPEFSLLKAETGCPSCYLRPGLTCASEGRSARSHKPPALKTNVRCCLRSSAHSPPSAPSAVPRRPVSRVAAAAIQPSVKRQGRTQKTRR